MSDQLGNLALPVVPPEGPASIGDPVLDVLVDFMAAAIKDGAGQAWDAASGNLGNNPVTKRVFTHDPGQEAFREATLPALYLWRHSWAKERQISAGIRIRPSVLRLRWVPLQPNSQERKRVWSPLPNAMQAVLDLAIERGRTPSWLAAGDTDPMAATFGSFLFASAQLWRLELTSVKPVEWVLPMESPTPPTRFMGVDFELVVEERLTEDPLQVGFLAGDMTLTIVAPAQPPDLPDTLPLVAGRFEADE